MGKLTARTIDIRDTYEVPAVIENSKLVNIDVDYLNSKADHLTQVCDHEVVGWYKTGSLLPTENDETIARILQEQKDATLLLKVDPCKKDRETNELPVTLFELETNGGLLQKKFTMEAKDAERIAVETLANDYSGSSHEYGSLMRLSMKIKVVENYLDAVIKGELEPQQEVLRQINLIIRKLPKSPDSTLNKTSIEASAISSLATVTHGSQLLQQLLQKLEMIQEKKQAGPRLRGLMI